MSYPLSQTQMGIYVSSINAQGEGKYNINLLYKLDDCVDLDRLVCAIDKVVAAHPTLFTRLATSDEGDVVFEEHADETFHTPVMTIASLDDVQDRIGADYDLMNDRLFRVELYRLASQPSVYLYVDIHHIISDGMTVVHFMQEIGEVYDGGEPHAEPKNIFDLNLEEENLRKSDAYDEAKAWYKDNFAAASGLDSLPQSDLHGEDRPGGIDVVERPLKVDVDTVSAFCKQEGVRPASYYTAAFAFLLSKYAGSDEVLFSTIYHGRPNREDRSAYSMMVKTLPVYQSMEATPTVAELMRSTSEQIIGSRKRTCYSFAEVHQDLGLDANIMFAYQGTLNNYALVLGGSAQQNMNISRNIPGMAINVKLLETEEGPVAQFKYQTEKYSRALIEDMAMSYEKVLSEFFVQENLSEVNIVSPEQQKVLDAFRNVGVAEVPYKRFYEPIEHYAEVTPDAKAIVACDRTLTYKQLNEEANRIAHALINKGVKPGDRVVLLLPRTSQVLCCMFGVSKAGAAYIPCDPAYPAERISLILEDSEAKYVVTTSDHLSEHGEKAILVDDLFKEQNVSVPSRLGEDWGEGPLAYLIYTSGSTGRPKGVMLRHEAICNYLYNHPANRHIHALVCEGVQAYLCLTTLSFDMSLKEFGVALHNGLTCVLANEEECENPMLLADLMRRNNVEAMNATPSRLLGYMEIPEFEEALSHCKIVMSGGEKYSSVLLDKLHSIKGLRIFNTYGPTEITVSSNAAELTHTSFITIGQPLLNYHEWVVDQYGNELPVGVVGELYIGGMGVAKGYNNLPEKTAEAFIEYGSMRAYKSGDYARWGRDGHIEVLGRKDGQIKLHGLRIEIGEIESCINKCPGIKQSVVKVCHINDDDFLVAYFTANGQIDADSLKADISTTLTHYMVPSAFVQLEAFPLTPNGKTDVRNLPIPELKAESRQPKAEGASEMNDLEKQLYDIVAEAVKLPSLADNATPSFGVNDALYLVGLSSLSAIKVATLIYKRFGLQLKSQALMRGESLFSIENQILGLWLTPRESESAQLAGLAAVSSPVADGREEIPLTYPQTGVYIDCLKNPGTTMYNVPARYTLPANVSAEELVAAVRATIDNHQSFKLVFTNKSGVPAQVIDDGIQCDIPVCDRTEEDIPALDSEFVQPFDVTRGPLFRFMVVRTAQHLYLYADRHHLITDGGSNNIVIKEIAARLNGEPVESEDYSYLQFAADQKAAESGEDYQEAKDFFHSRLQACEGASEITPNRKKDEAALHTQGWSKSRVDFAPVEALAKQLGVTPMSIFLAATYYTVCRFVNNKQVYLGTISNGRSNLRTYNTTGMFVNTLALSSEIKEQTVADFVRETARNFSETIEHEQYPFSQIAADYGFKPEIVFEYQVGASDNAIVRGQSTQMRGLTLDLAKFKLKITVNNTPDGGHCVMVGFDQAFYTQELATTLAESTAAVVAHFAAQPEGLVRNVSIISSEQQKVVDTFHTTAVADVPFKRFYEPIEYWAEKTPDALAVYACDRQLTFRAFNEECNRVANALIARGVKPGDRVVLLLPRTSQVLCCIFGVSKTGAAYIPCDPAYPAERINLILEDSEAKYVITTADHLSEHGEKAILVDDLFEEQNVSAPSRMGEDWGEGPLAYLIYTSGSTGRPKGVMLRHEGICSYLYDHPANIHIHGLKEEGVKAFLCITTLSFDMSLKEFAGALHNGITAVLANEDEVNNPILLAELFRKTGAQAINGTPSRILNCMESEDFCEALSHCKVIWSGGEKYSDKLLERLHDMGLRIFNTYGPTEITVSSNIGELTHQDYISVGRPLLNYHEWVVDADGNELPAGVVGELYIGGPGVARGYNNLPEQTAARFVEYNGVRVYKSGDYARWLPDGQVDILGRLDNQVKLNGLRIELGEVESAISKVEGVKQTVVMICNISGRDHLSAYYVADRKIDIEDMKAQIGQTLTHYMVPTAYLQMEKFPLTPNGKTDVKNLPEPLLAQQGGDYVAPRNKAEEDFCHAFEKILGLEKVSAADSFFDLGGTSLTATRVLIEAKNCGYDIAYSDVFKYHTAQMLAKLVGSADADAGAEADTEVEDYDYTQINALLAENNLDNFRKGERLQLGDVVLTGANGYLGIHILYDLLENHLQQHPECKVYCLVRHGRNGVSSESRLRNLLFYYFEKSYRVMFGTQLIVIDGDVTSPKAFEELQAMIDTNRSLPSGGEQERVPLTLINCAAIVKHFSEGTEIEDINVGGLQNCVDFCLKTGARLIQTSTNSTGGRSVNGYPDPKTNYSEQIHYFGQNLSSKYARSKFIAERIVLESIIERGLVAKVVRLGNLAPRAVDGEFQINFRSNSAMGRLHIYQMLDCISYSAATGKMEFSPIDEVAKAVLLLATTPKECTIFHPFNNHMELLGDIVREMAHTLNVDIEEVEDDIFNAKINEAAQDPEKAKILQSMLAYKANSHTTSTVFQKYNPYTIQVLYRLGFHWNVTSWDYVQKFIKTIAAMDFFEDHR